MILASFLGVFGLTNRAKLAIISACFEKFHILDFHDKTMISTILANALASTILFLNPLASPASPQYVFTQHLPESNFVVHYAQENESLGVLAKLHYGDERYWTTIWNDNPWIEDTDNPGKNGLVKLRVEKPQAVEELASNLRIKELQQEEQTEALWASAKAKAVPQVAPTPRPTTVATQGPASGFDEVYREAGAKFGIPWQILYGLHITETGGRDGAISSGFGTGAQGPMQFMPGTWRAYGVDGNGDGVADINNAVDAIHGAANYLAKHGSLHAGLRAYGGNMTRTLALARERGFSE